MIPMPSDYNATRAFDGESERLTPGGHICRIISAKMEKSKSGRDMLCVAFDIEEGGPLDGYFRRRHAYSSKYSTNAKWPGTFRCTILTAEGKTSGFFKGLITSVEDSNSGYSFQATNGDERALCGKMVGFNFGEEEYEANDGSIRVSVKPAYAVPVSRVRDGIQPPALKALKTGSGSAAPAQQSNGFTQVQMPEEDLPF